MSDDNGLLEERRQFNARIRELEAALEAAGALQPRAPAETLADRIVRDVAELPDRTSPDDWPEAMLVTSNELHAIVHAALREATPALEKEGYGNARCICGHLSSHHNCDHATSDTSCFDCGCEAFATIQKSQGAAAPPLSLEALQQTVLPGAEQAEVTSWKLTNPAAPGPYGTHYWICNCSPFLAILNGRVCPNCAAATAIVAAAPLLSREALETLIPRVMDALESGATVDQRRAAWNDLRDWLEAALRPVASPALLPPQEP